VCKGRPLAGQSRSDQEAIGRLGIERGHNAYGTRRPRRRKPERPSAQEDCEVRLSEPGRLGCVVGELQGGRMLHGGLKSMEVRHVAYSLGIVG
jgi:hypothetical protein